MSAAKKTLSDAKKQQPKKVVRVEDVDAQVTLRPESNDLFVRTGRQVIEACRMGISIDLWMSELMGMLSYVQKWAGGQEGRIRDCYGAPKGAKTMLFFVPVSEQFDFDLADALAELTSDLVKNFNIGMVEVRQIPSAELDRFLEAESAAHIYGEQGRSSQAVEAQS